MKTQDRIEKAIELLRSLEIPYVENNITIYRKALEWVLKDEMENKSE